MFNGAMEGLVLIWSKSSIQKIANRSDGCRERSRPTTEIIQIHTQSGCLPPPADFKDFV